MPEAQQLPISSTLDDNPTPVEESTLTGLNRYCQDIYDEYRKSEYRQKKLDEIEEGRKRYKGDLPVKSFPWPNASNKSMGLEAIAVDNLEPRIKSQLIGEEDFIQVEPVGPEDVESVQQVKDFIHWAVLNNMRLPETIKPLVHDLLMDGTKIVVPIWREELRINKIRTTIPIYVDHMGQRVEVPPNVPPPMLQQAGVQQQGFEEKFEDREEPVFQVDLDLIPLHDCFFPDTGDDWWEQPFLRYIYPTLEELKQLTEENGGPYFGITDDLSTDPARTGDSEKDKSTEDIGVKYSEYSDEVRLLECYVKDKGKWTLATFAVNSGFKNVRKQLIADIYPHGRKPVHRFSIFRETNESMGTGIPTKIRHFSTGIDDLYNQMIDCASIEIMPYGTIEDDSGIETLDMTISPGELKIVPKGSNISYPKLGIKSTVNLQFIEVLLGFFERTISIMDQTNAGTLGRGGAGTETFSGMSLIVQEGNIKHGYMGESLQDIFGRLLTDIFGLYSQNMPLDAKQRIFDPNVNQFAFQPIDVLSLQGRWDFKIQVSNSSANKMLNRKEAMERYQTLGGNPLANPQKLLEDALRAYDIKSTGEYIKPEINQLLQALQQVPGLAQALPQMIQQFAQQQEQQKQQQDIQQQAQSNIQRQGIERQMEQPQEGEKLVDQAQESIKRRLITQGLENQIGVG